MQYYYNMAGIVKSTKKRIVINKQIREIENPTDTLDTSQFYTDLNAIGSSNNPSIITQELNKLPAVVKNEAVMAIVAGAMQNGAINAMNGDTKTIESLPFTRNSSGTSFAADGSLSIYNANTPRTNYKSDNMELYGYIFEPSSTNLLTQSGLQGGLVDLPNRSAAGITAVDTGFNMGYLLAKGVSISKGSELSFGYKNFLTDAGVDYVFSCFVKVEDGSDITDTDVRLFFNNVYNKITIDKKYTSGVYRVFATAKGSGSNISVGAVKGTTESSRPVIVTGYQLEIGTYPTSYIPTTTATATRLADKAVGSRPLSVFSFNSWYMDSDLYKGWLGNGVNKLTQAGRNYIKNSVSFSTFINNNGTLYTLTTGKENGVPWVNSIVKSTGKFYLSLSGDLLNSSLFSEDMTGQELVQSIDVMSTASLKLTILNTDYNLVAGQWTRIKANIPADKSDKRMCAINAISNPEVPEDTKIYFKNWKIEKGTVETPWSIAPEDIVKIDANGNVEISSDVPVNIRSLSLVARQLKQSEV